MRKVVLKLTTQKDVIEHQSEARTFGELKKEMRQVKWTGMRVVERSTKTTLQMDEAVLPQGEFLLFLVPEKVKSGKKSDGGAETLTKPIKDCKYNECRSHMSWLNRNKSANLDMSGGTAELQKELEKYYKKNPAGKAAPKAEAEKPVAKKPAANAPKEKLYVASPKQEDEDDEDYEDRITFEKKSFEKKAKKAAIKAEEERLAKEQKEKEDQEKEEEAAKKSAKKEKKGKKGTAEVASEITDPIEIIENSRTNINLAVDALVLEMIENGGTGQVPAVLQYTEKDLEKEINKVRNALRTSRSQASYID